MAEEQSNGAKAVAQPPTDPSKFGKYQNEIYFKGMFHDSHPTVTCNPNNLEEQARQVMRDTAWTYIAGGAGEKATMDANRLAFRQWKLIPRMLRDISTRDLSVTLFGEKYKSPFLIAPLGVQKIFHEDREIGMAKVAAELEIPYIMSTASSSSIEEVAEANGNGHRWYQLYWPDSNDLTISILNRAKKNGFKVLVVTLDTFMLSWRPADLDLGYLPFVKGIGNQVPCSDPVFRARFKEKTGKEVDDDALGAYIDWASDTFSGRGHTWDQLKLLKDNWDGSIVLKGIQSREDAIMALTYGMDGIVVSNHGGRQLDGAVGSLEMLPEIVDAVGDKMTVLFDSGIRTGSDVIKALCLGAKAVLVGRPWAYGFGIAGSEGAKHVLRGLQADFDQGMALSGIASVANCNRGMLRKVVYGGDGHSSF